MLGAQVPDRLLMLHARFASEPHNILTGQTRPIRPFHSKSDSSAASSSCSVHKITNRELIRPPRCHANGLVPCHVKHHEKSQNPNHKPDKSLRVYQNPAAAALSSQVLSFLFIAASIFLPMPPSLFFRPCHCQSIG